MLAGQPYRAAGAHRPKESASDSHTRFAALGSKEGRVLNARTGLCAGGRDRGREREGRDTFTVLRTEQEGFVARDLASMSAFV